MDAASKALADKVLGQVLVGKTVVGMYFRNPILWFATVVDRVIQGDEVYLSIENDWACVPTTDLASYGDLALMHHTEWQALSSTALKLADSRAIKAEVDLSRSHRVIEFDDGHSFVALGDDMMYESWDLRAGDFQIVATPGTDLAIWHPDDFHAA